MIDIHSHILPDVDDGARHLDEALEMASIASADGIQQMVCTPHMFNGISDNPQPAEIVERVEEFQAAIYAKDPKGLKVLPGNEVHVSHEIAEQAKTDRVTKLNRKNYMLVEFPTMTVPIGADELFYRLQLNGVKPILVHPERNSQLQARPSMVAGFIERGVYVQVTAMSVTGEFGAAAKNCADSLLRHNCVHFLATDAHRAERRPPILSRGRDAAAAVIGAEKALKLVWDNPLAVVTGGVIQADAPMPYGGPTDKKTSFFGKLFGR
jgi:protein-tyrosine phosphatase